MTAAAVPLPHDYYAVEDFELVEGLSGRAAPRTPAQVEELAGSIEQRGQQDPVQFVGPAEPGSRKIIAKGHGRLAAIRKLLAEKRSWPGGPGVWGVPNHRQGEIEDIHDEIVLDALHENIHRHTLRPRDVLPHILQRQGAGMENQAIAMRLGVSPGYISQILAYGRCAPAVRDAIDAGRISFRRSRELSNLPAAEQGRRLAALERHQQAGRKRAKAAPTKKKAAAKQAAAHQNGDRNRKNRAVPAGRPAGLDAYAKTGGDRAGIRTLLLAIRGFIEGPEDSPARVAALAKAAARAVEKLVAIHRAAQLRRLRRECGQTRAETRAARTALPGKTVENKQRTVRPPARPAGKPASGRNP